MKSVGYYNLGAAVIIALMAIDSHVTWLWWLTIPNIISAGLNFWMSKKL
jgi:hypothetical protein